jgi:hypothetical protein
MRDPSGTLMPSRTGGENHLHLFHADGASMTGLHLMIAVESLPSMAAVSLTYRALVSLPVSDSVSQTECKSTPEKATILPDFPPHVFPNTLSLKILPKPLLLSGHRSHDFPVSISDHYLPSDAQRQLRLNAHLAKQRSMQQDRGPSS